MTAFGKLIRTTAFRLTLVYLFLFALFAASLLGYFAWNTRRLINEQITATVNVETAEIIDIYTRRGLRGLVFTIENRALRPGANLYLVTTPEGKAIGGNVGSLAPGVMASTGWSETAYRRLDEQDTAHHRALVRVTELTNGFRLLVGRDLEERRRLFGIVAKAAQWSLLVVIVLGIGGGIFVARRVLRADRRHDRHHTGGSWPATSPGGCRSDAAATNSIGSRKTSMRCWSASRR